jgi:pSer/pThr/pTyr-binding forkhead associated (FHA) protein
MARLFISHDGGAPISKELNLGLTRVGRGDDNHIVIAHASVSYHHCEFDLGMDSLIVRDCGSTNGTFVNDRPIQEAALDPNARVRLGQVEVKVEWHRDRVEVPAMAAPRPLGSVLLADNIMSCHTHQAVPSVWHCPKCAQYFCGRCARGVNIVGRPVHKLCPLCSGHVQVAPWAEGGRGKQSLWGRVKKALSRTVRVR